MAVTYLRAFINIFTDIFIFIFFVRALLSWFPNKPHHLLINFIHDVTDPILRPVKRIIPPIGMIDISVMVVMIGLDLLRTLLLAMLTVS